MSRVYIVAVVLLGAVTASAATVRLESRWLTVEVDRATGAWALTADWDDAYTFPEVTSALPENGPVRQRLTTTFRLRRTARSVRLTPLGTGDWNTIATGYRLIAQQKGLAATPTTYPPTPSAAAMSPWPTPSAAFRSSATWAVFTTTCRTCTPTPRVST